MKRKLIVLAIAVGLLLSILTLGVCAADGDQQNTIDYYGRAALAECENATALLYAYDALTAGVEGSLSTINVYNGSDKITQDEIKVVMDAYRRDRADHFWIGNQYSVSIKGDNVIGITPEYLFSGDELTAAKAAVEYEVVSILSGVQSDWSDFEKLVYFHDTLASRIDYVDGENAHNLYGAFVNGKVVCEGYAEALQYLLHRAGIEAFLAIGKGINPSTLTTEGHEWSYVKINGQWCHVDLTWNDQGSKIYHAYFGLTDAEISVDHVIEDAGFALPVCDSEINNYFAVMGGVMNSPYSVDDIAAVLNNGGKSGSFYASDVNGFIDFVKANVSSIGRKCEINEIFNISIFTMGNEVKLAINLLGCRHTSISHVAQTPSGCNLSGVMEHYACDECGKTFSDANGTYPVSNSELKLPPLTHSYTVENHSVDYVKCDTNCKEKVTYWYACEHCGRSAGLDVSALDKFFEGDSLGSHSFSEAWTTSDGEHWHACTTVGCNAKDSVGACSGGTPTCKDQAVCEVCLNPYGELLDVHEYDTTAFGHKEANGHAHKCSVCGGHDELLPHVTEEGAAATEDTALVCSDCGYIITPALNHKDNHIAAENWTFDAIAHWHECTGCEGQRMNYRIHIDKDRDGLCDSCAYPVPVDPTPDPIKDHLLALTERLTKEQVIYVLLGIAAIIVVSLFIRIAIITNKKRKW